MEEIEELNEQLHEHLAARERAAQIPWCDLYALLCNLLGGGKRTWTRDDFMAKEDGNVAPPAEVEAGIRAYQEAVARGRERRKGGGSAPAP